MATSREPIFLGRETYRRRRLIDAMRFLPVVGACFFMAPFLGGSANQHSTARAGLFLFTVWLVLIVLAGLLVNRLSRAPGGLGNDPLDPDPGTGPGEEPPRR